MPRLLPRSLDDLRGLRVARWIRESRKAQEDNFGPDAQRWQQDKAIDRLGLVDTGRVWQVTRSGRVVGSSDEFAAMLAGAGNEYEVLLVGYVSRFARDLETAVSARRKIHEAGAAILFCDEMILSSDEGQWEQWAREALEAEAYSRRLAKRIREGHESKYRRFSDPAFLAPLGFRRQTERPYLMEVDADTVGQAVYLYEKYALGNVSADDLAAERVAIVQRGKYAGQPMSREGIADVLANPIYNGWIAQGGERKEAGWRTDPPIDDDLWQRVQEVRASKVRGGGPRRKDFVDVLAGLLHCADCGRRLRSDGRDGNGSHRKRHPQPCSAWGSQQRYASAVYEWPILAQVSSLDLSAGTMAQVVNALSAPPSLPDDLGRRRLDRERSALYQHYVRGDTSGADFLAEDQRLAEQLAALTSRPDAPQIHSDQAIAYLQDLRSTWADAGEQERSDLVHACYDRIEVSGPHFMAVTLTPEAEAHGLSLALSEQVNTRSISRLPERPRQDSNLRPAA